MSRRPPVPTEKKDADREAEHRFFVLIKDSGHEFAVRAVVSGDDPWDLNIQALARQAWSMPLRTLKKGNVTIKVETIEADKQDYWAKKLFRQRRMRLRLILMDVAWASIPSCLIALVISRIWGTSFVQLFIALLGFFLASIIARWLRRPPTRMWVIVKNVLLYLIAALAYAVVTANGDVLSIGLALMLFSLPLVLAIAFEWALFFTDL